MLFTDHELIPKTLEKPVSKFNIYFPFFLVILRGQGGIKM